MTKTTIYPSEKLEKRLKTLAKKESRSLNSQILVILEEYFKNQEVRCLKGE